jgi:hypothetical protein
MKRGRFSEEEIVGIQHPDLENARPALNVARAESEQENRVWPQTSNSQFPRERSGIIEANVHYHSLPWVGRTASPRVQCMDYRNLSIREFMSGLLGICLELCGGVSQEPVSL